MGDETTRRPAVDPGDLGGGEVAPGALVGDGGVDIAVGDDDGAAFEGGADDAVDVLGAVGGEHQRLGAVREPGGGHVQDDRAQPLADGGGARLPGDDDLVALGADPLGQRLDLGGLPGAVAALQGDEEAGGGGRLVRVAAAQRLAQIAPQRYAVPVVGLAQHPGGDRQQQRADQHQGEGGATVRKREAAVLEAVRADDGGQQRSDNGGQRDREADDGV